MCSSETRTWYFTLAPGGGSAPLRFVRKQAVLSAAHLAVRARPSFMRRQSSTYLLPESLLLLPPPPPFCPFLSASYARRLSGSAQVTWNIFGVGMLSERVRAGNRCSQEYAGKRCSQEYATANDWCTDILKTRIYIALSCSDGSAHPCA